MSHGNGRWAAKRLRDACELGLTQFSLYGGLPHNVLDAIGRAEAATAHNDRMTLFAALNYCGRQEVLDAAER